MVDIIIKKPYERFDWKEKIEGMSTVEAQEWQIKEYLKVQDDIEYWFKQYVWTINTKLSKPIIPFMLYDYEIELVHNLSQLVDIFIEKSRQMGISWTIMGWELHQALYTEGFSALNVSRKESEVQDAGNTFHALMGRLFFMWGKLPPFIRPRIHNPFLSFQVPSTNSVIKGESANPNAGRDTNYKFILLDEAGHIQCLDEMWKSVRQSSDAICVNSTPPKEVVNNKYVELKDMKNSGFKKLKFHWKQHPDKNQDWFNKKTQSMEEEEIAQELEIGYDKSLTNRSYPEYQESVHLTSNKIFFNPKFKLNVFMDFGLDGEVFLYSQICNDRIFFIKYHIYRNLLTYEAYKQMLKDLHELGFRGEIKDIAFIGDVAGTKRSRQTKTSVIDEYYKVSDGAMAIRSKTMSNANKMLAVKHCLKRYIDGRPQFNISNEISCLKFNQSMKVLSLNKTKDDHVDNKYTHVVNAAEYGINWFFPYKGASASMVSVDIDQDGQRLINGDVILEEVKPAQDGIDDDKIKIESPSTIYSIIGNNRRNNRRSSIWA